MSITKDFGTHYGAGAAAQTPSYAPVFTQGAAEAATEDTSLAATLGLTNGGWKGTGGALLANTAISAIGGMVTGFYAARTQRIQAKWAAQIAEENQKLSILAAEDSLYQSAFNIGQISQKAQQVKAKARTSAAAAGVDIGASRSFAEAQTTTDYFKEASIQEERFNGLRRAWGYRMQGLNYAGQAGAFAAQAKASSPLGGAVSGFATGLASGVSEYRSTLTDIALAKQLKIK